MSRAAAPSNWVLAAALILETASTNASAAALACRTPIVRISDPSASPEAVFTFRRDRCNDLDFPDYPAMAFRDADGMVQLLDTNGNGNYRSIGTSLDTIRRDCRAPVLTSNPNASAPPEAFYNYVWITAPWTADGRMITALVHNEFQGWRKAVNPAPNGATHCSAVGDNFIDMHCAFWNLTLARSSDAGLSFQIVKDAAGRGTPVFTTPYAYEKDGGRPGSSNLQSMATNSNIVMRADAPTPDYYILVENNIGHDAPGGTCLFRTTDPSDPAGWRGWDGKAFSIAQNASVYRDPGLDPAAHVCTPIVPWHGMESWTYNTELGEYLAIYRNTRFKKADGSFIEAFTSMVSADMIHWSAPVFLKEIVWLDQWQKSQPRSGVSGHMYPSLIDPTSAGRLFDRSGKSPYLYYTRLNPKQVPFAFDRDLVREKLTVSCGD